MSRQNPRSFQDFQDPKSFHDIQDIKIFQRSWQDIQDVKRWDVYLFASTKTNLFEFFPQIRLKRA